jgi:DNA-binding NarL/FixJ family response regulator
MQQAQWVISAVTGTAHDPAETGPADFAPEGSRSKSARRSLASPETERKLRVLVCSADPFTRRAFGSAASSPDVDVIARSNLTDAVETLAAELEPDVVILDVQVAAPTALRTLQQLRSQAPEARILACDAPATSEFGLLCLLAGAAGYMSKEADLAALPRILRRLAAGEAVTSRELASELVHRFVSAGRRAPSPSDRTLSGPESQVLELLRMGQSLAQIADRLSIRPATAQRHLGSARRKLSAQPTMEIAGGRPHVHQSDELEVR